jgi:hypothetical protein
MKNYLHIGGNQDGLSHPAADDAETVVWPVGVVAKEKYIRETLTLGNTSIMVYVHESLAPAQALILLVEHYRAWAVNRPGGRR